MKDSFQTILLIVFIAAAVIGLLIFSGLIPLGEGGDDEPKGTVVLWGTIPFANITDALSSFHLENADFRVQYVEKSNATFDRELLEALASGRGPDMFFLPDDLVLSYRNKIVPVPYANFPVAAYNKNFVSGADVFLSSQGILALPIAIDPMVMYYNRSLLDAEAIIFPPVYWDEFPDIVSRLTKKEQDGRILQSAVALGQFSNITNAKNILSAMLMQSGNPIIAEQDGRLASTLNTYSNKYNLPAILGFYASFTDPQSSTYSWNRSFPNSRDAFSADSLATYFGFASELEALQSRNPNQNFLPAPFPQIRGSNSKVTAARITGIAVASSSKNLTTAFYAANLLTTGNFARQFALDTGLTPARRDLLAVAPTDAYAPVFYNAALYAKGWLDPSPLETDNIFRSMVDKVLSNALTPEDAIRDADARLWLLLGR